MDGYEGESAIIDESEFVIFLLVNYKFVRFLWFFLLNYFGKLTPCVKPCSALTEVEHFNLLCILPSSCAKFYYMFPPARNEILFAVPSNTSLKCGIILIKVCMRFNGYQLLKVKFHIIFYYLINITVLNIYKKIYTSII